MNFVMENYLIIPHNYIFSLTPSLSSRAFFAKLLLKVRFFFGELFHIQDRIQVIDAESVGFFLSVISSEIFHQVLDETFITPSSFLKT